MPAVLCRKGRRWKPEPQTFDSSELRRGRSRSFGGHCCRAASRDPCQTTTCSCGEKFDSEGLQTSRRNAPRNLRSMIPSFYFQFTSSAPLFWSAHRLPRCSTTHGRALPRWSLCALLAFFPGYFLARLHSQRIGPQSCTTLPVAPPCPRPPSQDAQSILGGMVFVSNRPGCLKGTTLTETLPLVLARSAGLRLGLPAVDSPPVPRSSPWLHSADHKLLCSCR